MAKTKTPYTPPKVVMPAPSMMLNGVAYYTQLEVRRMIQDACKMQIEICANMGVHYKFGWYKFQPDKMRKETPVTPIEFT